MNFTVCLIAKNESKTLPRLLASLEEFQKRGGRVLLLDTGSTDNTIEVAESLGCEVTAVGAKFVVTISPEQAQAINDRFVVGGEAPLVQPGDKLFDYASARNFIAELSPTDMIAMPDCDEVYTQLDLDGVAAAIRDGAEQLEYNFVFSHDQYGNEVIKFRHCKFYDRRKLKWVGIIHEVLQGAAERRFLPESIIKLEHFQNHETDRSGYLRGLALDCFTHPDNDRNSHYLGREMLWLGRPQSAIQELKRHVDMQRWPAERGQSMLFIGDAYLKLGQPEQALEWFLKGYLVEPARREALIRLAEYYYHRQQPLQCAVFAAAALEVPDSSFYADNRAHYTFYPHEMLYWAKWAQGDKAASKQHFLEAWHYNPKNLKYMNDAIWYDLPKVSIVIPTLGRPEGLQHTLDSIADLSYPQDLIEVIVEEDSFENRRGVPLTLHKGVARSTGEIIVYAANDMQFLPDSLTVAVLHSLYYNKKLVAFNSGELTADEGNICEHFLIWRDFIPEIGGEIFDTEFNHVGVDNLLWAKAKRLGQADRCEEAQIYHRHWSRGGKMDEVYKLAWDPDSVKRDRELLKKKLHDLAQSD